MKKLIIGLFFVLGLLFALPTTAQAVNYNLWVGGERVTDDNKGAVTGYGIEGTVTYDPDTEILTLNNAHITGVYTDTAAYYEGNTYGIYFHSIDLTINLVGNNSINVPANPAPSADCSGIHQRALDVKDLTIQGDGNLTVCVGDARYVQCIYGSRGSMTIGGEARLTLIAGSATNQSLGIFYEMARTGAPYAITIQDQAQVTIEADSGAKGAIAICSNSPILITGDAKVTATVLGKSTANSDNTYGIYSTNGKVAISGDAEVSAAGGDTAGTSSLSCGVYGSTVEVMDGAELDAASGESDGTGGKSYGISCYHSVTISDTAQVTATGGAAADGVSYGIACRTADASKIQFTHDTILVSAQGGTQAFSKLPVDGSDTPLVIPGWDGTALVTYPPAPTYSVELDQSGTHVFTAQKTGYSDQTPLTVTVTNTGNQPTGELTVALSGADADSYTLSVAALDSIAVSGTDSFNVVPNTGLRAGTYTATVTVSGENGISASIDLSFTVKKKSSGGKGGSNESSNNSDNSNNNSTENSFGSLTHSTTGIRAEGSLAGELEVKPLVETGTGAANEIVDPATFNELKVTVDNGYTVIGAYEVKLTSYEGSLNLTFPAGDEHNGKSYLVKHRTSSGKIITYTGTVEKGKIMIQVTELSPFMIAILEPQVTPDTPDTKINNPFSDVRESDWFYNTVMQNLKRGLLKGTSASTFSPGAPMTRGMFAAVLARMDGADLSGYTTTSFSDVDMSKYYGPSVAWAAEKGIIAGYGNGPFGAGDSINREQMAAMLAKYIRVRDIKVSATKPEAGYFADDSQISPWAKNSVYLMQVYGLIGGRPGNLYDPKSVATRAEVAQVLLNYFNGVK